MRKKNDPEIFLNKKASVVGGSFLKTIDDSYIEFIEDKDGFKFPFEDDINNSFGESVEILTPLWLKKRYWVGLKVSIEKRTITLIDTLGSKMTEKSKRSHLGAYSVAIPYVICNNKEEEKDVSAYKIVIDDKYPRVSNVEDSGIYMLKVLECLLMRVNDWSKLSEKTLGDLRKKLASDIFSEMQN